MPRFSQQTKDGLTVLITLGVGVVTGFFVDEWTKHENVVITLVCLVLLGSAQLALAFSTSKDMADLEEYRRGDMAELKLKNAMAEKAQKFAEDGNLSEALEWRDASQGLGTGRKHP